VSIIVGPNGELLADPVVGGEGMVIAEIDIASSIEHKMAHDIVGYYNRFDSSPFSTRKMCPTILSARRFPLRSRTT